MSRALPAQNTNNTFTPDNLINAVDTAGNLVNQYIVAPRANIGLAGFVFDVEDETSVELTSNITDHYSEDNSYLQDHIALEPDRIVLRRYVGELVYHGEPGTSTLEKLAQKITTIAGYVPVITAAARQTQSAIATATSTQSQMKDYLDASIGTGVDLYQTFKTLNPPKTKQAQAFNFVRALWNARQLVSLETPYSFYTNMAIEKVTVVQSAESRDISDFTITLKKIRTAATKFVTFDPKKYQGRTLGQASTLQEKGQANGTLQTPAQKQSFFSALRDQVL